MPIDVRPFLAAASVAVATRRAVGRSAISGPGTVASIGPLTCTMPFRTAYSNDEARKYLAEWAAIEFDPRVAKVLLELDINEPVGNVSVNIEQAI